MDYSKDYYALLGVSCSASAQEIHQAYRKMAFLWHPDRHTTDSISAQKEAKNRFIEINEAYSILSDESQRLVYDLFRMETRHIDSTNHPAIKKPPLSWRALLPMFSILSFYVFYGGLTLWLTMEDTGDIQAIINDRDIIIAIPLLALAVIALIYVWNHESKEQKI